MDDMARSREEASVARYGRDARAPASFDGGLMIYGMVLGPVAVGASCLAARLVGGSGIAAFVISAALVVIAGCYADPVLRRLRSPSRPL